MFFISVHSAARLFLQGFLSDHVPWSGMEDYESLHIEKQTELFGKYLAYTDRVNIQTSLCAKSHFREIYCPPLPPAPQQRGVDFGCLNISVFTFL